MLESQKNMARPQALPTVRFIAKTRKFLTTLLLCLILTAAFSIIIQIKPASATTRNVPANYPTIQAAIDAALAGDVIQVALGTYREHLDVAKSLTIVGANSLTTIIDGMSNGTVILLEATTITITGFTIRNAGNSYTAVTAEDIVAANDYHIIKNNIIRDCTNGVSIGSSSYDTIVGNTFINNSITGIILSSATNTNITGNTISQSAYGIKLASSTTNTIASNVMSAIGAYGIYLSSTSTGNTITRNSISARSAGIYITSDNNSVDHNTVSQSDFGIYFYNCINGPIYYNYLYNNSRGIRLYSTSPYSSSATVRNNKATYNTWGIELISTSSTTFTGNWLQRNTWGVSISSAAYNTFYHNDFVNNIVQATSDSLDYWNTTTDGNYWSDYTGGGKYPIIPGYDYHPLKTTWSEHDIAIQSVTTSANQAVSGSIINITIKVTNNANITVSETFTVTAKYNSTIIGTQQVTNLTKGATQTLTFNWNTAGITGKYIISTVASTVTDELNTDNNQFTDGTVKILYLGDINQDGTVNLADLTLFNQSYGSTLGQLNWNPNADLNKDNIINALDLFILSKNYGKSS